MDAGVLVHWVLGWFMDPLAEYLKDDLHRAVALFFADLLIAAAIIFEPFWHAMYGFFGHALA